MTPMLASRYVCPHKPQLGMRFRPPGSASSLPLHDPRLAHRTMSLYPSPAVFSRAPRSAPRDHTVISASYSDKERRNEWVEVVHSKESSEFSSTCSRVSVRPYSHLTLKLYSVYARTRSIKPATTPAGIHPLFFFFSSSPTTTRMLTNIFQPTKKSISRVGTTPPAFSEQMPAPSALLRQSTAMPLPVPVGNTNEDLDNAAAIFEPITSGPEDTRHRERVPEALRHSVAPCELVLSR